MLTEKIMATQLNSLKKMKDTPTIDFIKDNVHCVGNGYMVAKAPEEESNRNSGQNAIVEKLFNTVNEYKNAVSLNSDSLYRLVKGLNSSGLYNSARLNFKNNHNLIIEASDLSYSSTTIKTTYIGDPIDFTVTISIKKLFIILKAMHSFSIKSKDFSLFFDPKKELSPISFYDSLSDYTAILSVIRTY